MVSKPTQAQLDTIVRNVARILADIQIKPGGGSVRVGHPQLDTAVLVVKLPGAFHLITGMAEQLDQMMEMMTGTASAHHTESHEPREDDNGPSLN